MYYFDYSSLKEDIAKSIALKLEGDYVSWYKYTELADDILEKIKWAVIDEQEVTEIAKEKCKDSEDETYWKGFEDGVKTLADKIRSELP